MDTYIMDKESTKNYSITDITYFSIRVPIGEYAVTGHFGSLVNIEPAISIWLEAARKLLPTASIPLTVSFLIDELEITGKYQIDTLELNLPGFIQWLTAMIATRLSVLEMATNRAAEIHLEQGYTGGIVRIVRDNKHRPGRSHREYHLEKMSWGSRVRLLAMIYGRNWLYPFQDMTGNLHHYQASEEYIVNELIRLSKEDVDEVDKSRRYMDQANGIEALANFYKRWPKWASRLQTYLLRYYARLTLPGTAHYVQKSALRLIELIEPEAVLPALTDVTDEMTGWLHQMNLLKSRIEDKVKKPSIKPSSPEPTHNTLDIKTLQSQKVLKLETE